ncbi:hypothetical protein N658DRAFT_485634 [Parathielavia hyrcaniae]|uniref:Uncharacterized protein n=1 Tax=Parathielavia hyrcaniae TaxID=113614 RepID=A0AAN6T244_9PEZI|nr:hypothetical protein N658DRAFT_485634 [Parathielavia hyrcaniae]
MCVEGAATHRACLQKPAEGGDWFVPAPSAGAALGSAEVVAAAADEAVELVGNATVLETELATLELELLVTSTRCRVKVLVSVMVLVEVAVVMSSATAASGSARAARMRVRRCISAERRRCATECASGDAEGLCLWALSRMQAQPNTRILDSFDRPFQTKHSWMRRLKRWPTAALKDGTDVVIVEKRCA